MPAQSRGLGKGGSQASRPLYAARGCAPARCANLRFADRASGIFTRTVRPPPSPIPAAPRLSVASIEPNTRTRSATCFRLRWMSRPCFRRTIRATASTTSPPGNCLLPCWSDTSPAARQISRLAVGAAVKSPGGETVGHSRGPHSGRTISTSCLSAPAEELRSDTRFPLNGEYEIALRLTRDRNERIEGLTEPHQMELSVDGERVHLFALKPPARSEEHESADSRSKRVRIPVTAGPHVVAADVLSRSLPL
jgi:hypothetical protein